MARLSLRDERKESCGGGEWQRSEKFGVVKVGNWSGERKAVAVVMGFWIRGFKALEGMKQERSQRERSDQCGNPR